MSEVKVNKISPRTNCGTVTLGDSGDSFVIPAGATITNNGTQTGFGREGSVNWDTTAKTAGFTGVSGNGYFINTTSGAITVNLPASPSAGDIMSVKDYTGTFGTNACTVGRNSSNIRGAASDFALELNNAGATFVYVDGTEGWQVFVDGSDDDAQVAHIVATGGTITTSGDYKIHTFTGPGTFCVSQISSVSANNVVSYAIVGGGGGGGRDNYQVPRGGGGGGAGGFRELRGTISGCYAVSPLNGAPSIELTTTAYPITVGAGGAGGSGTGIPDSGGSKGSASTFSSVTSAGGGGGSGHASPSGGGNHSPAPSTQGASGGGYQYGQGPCSPNNAGLGNQPPVSPPQGQNAGDAAGSPGYAYGGGGGAGGTGGNAGPTTTGGTGGVGVSTSITGSSLSYSGGGGAYGSGANGGASPCGTGGAGGGANAGTTNRGGGGGGHRCATAGAGGSGVVIIRYKYQ